MHQVLRTDELVLIICEYLNPGPIRLISAPGRRALVALAQVCQGLSRIALDVLWRSVDMGTLYCLFPSHLIVQGVRRKKSFSRPPLTIEDWSRYDRYAYRIRTLRVHMPGPNENLKAILAVIALYRRQLHPFPNLKSLTWTGSVQRSHIVSTFLCPTLTDLELVCIGSSNSQEDEEAMANILRSLQEKKLSLRRLVLPHLPREGLVATIDLLRQSTLLVEVNVCASRGMMDALACLPSLRTLTLDRSHSSHIEPGRHRKLHLHRGASPFQALEHLKLSGKTLPELTRLLKDIQCIASRVVDIWFTRTVYSAPELAALLQVVIHPVISAGLRRFSLTMFGVQVPREGSSIKLDTLRPLLALRRLKAFNIEPCSYMDLMDSDLLEMARAWPGMTSLHLGTSFHSAEAFEQYQPRITLQGLEHLAVLPKLHDVAVTLAPESDGLASSLPPLGVSNSPLAVLQVGPGGLDIPVVDAALFLVQRFPELDTIVWVDDPLDHEDDENVGYNVDDSRTWQEIQDGLKGLQRVLHGAVQNGGHK